MTILTTSVVRKIAFYKRMEFGTPCTAMKMHCVSRSGHVPLLLVLLEPEAAVVVTLGDEEALEVRHAVEQTLVVGVRVHPAETGQKLSVSGSYPFTACFVQSIFLNAIYCGPSDKFLCTTCIRFIA